ncbi:MAG: hypothetical protein Q9179_002522 [Wetmoreana sp. 5 TL-2023]
MACGESKMNMGQHAPSCTAGLEDPFVTRAKDTPASLPVSRILPSEDGEIVEDENGKAAVETYSMSSTAFGDAPLYLQPSSTVKLPSSPASRMPPTADMPPDLGPPQRAPSSSLSANAAPFRPKSTSPASQSGNKRSVTFPGLLEGRNSGRGITYDIATGRIIDSPRIKVFGGYERKGSTPTKSKKGQRVSSPLVNELQQLPVRTSTGQVWPSQDVRLSTPSNAGQPGSPTRDRRMAYSDEPNLYKRTTIRTDDTPFLRQTQHGIQSCAPFSMPPSTGQRPGLYVSDSSIAGFQHNKNGNGLLNQSGQGTFHADQNGDSQSTIFDHYTPTPSVPPQNQPTAQTQINPYSQDGSTMGSGAYYPGSTNYPQQLQHHLYAALPPHRELNQPNQKTARELFIPENLRHTLARKTEASLMTIPNSTLPPTIAHFHSLVPLVHNGQKNTNNFGYISHAYKATSGHDGKLYCLRRLQGYRVNDASSEYAIRNIQSNWKRVRNGNVVSVHLAFTNSSFGDSSLIFVTDFHPLAETLAQKHFSPAQRYNNRYSTTHVTEQIVWAYVVQIGSALKSIHSAGLAARVIDASKVLLTGQNRIRLNACAILDVVQVDQHQALADVQRLDLHLFGTLIMALGTNNMYQQNPAKAMETFTRLYSPRLKEITNWLLEQTSPNCNDGIDEFLTMIAGDMVAAFDSSLHQDDALESALTRELENSRLVRLLTKMNFINERPEYEHDRQWAEHGNRYVIRLFRDYVFHQVDAQGNPVLDLAHVLSCLNRLDVGSEEKMVLTTRDEETVIVATFREVKACIEGAWGDLMRRAA